MGVDLFPVALLVGVEPVADAEDDHVAFIALYILEVLYEKRLMRRIAEELLARKILPAQDFHLF